MRLTGPIPKQSNSTAQIRPPPWLNLRRKPELDLLPQELDFLYGRVIVANFETRICVWSKVLGMLPGSKLKDHFFS